MELRSYSHLHFIQAVKGSLVIKALNVTRGRPALTLKKVKDIYDAGDAENHTSSPTTWPAEESECSQFNPKKIKSENSCFPRVQRRTMEVDASELSHSTGDEESTSESDDLSFVDMTLKQFKESCKVRKRKCAKPVDSGEKTFENSAPPKQEYTEPEEDVEELMEPLSSWKSRIAKNKKRKKCIRNHISTSSQNAIIMVKSEQLPTDQNFWQPSCYLPAPINIKVEINEPNSFGCQTMICDAAGSSFNCNEKVDSCRVVIDAAHVTASESVLETHVSTSLREEQSCVVNEASYEYVEFANPESVSDGRVSGWEIMNVDIPEIISYPCSGFPITDFENEGYVIHPLLDDHCPQPVSILKDHIPDIYHISQSHTSIHQLSWPNSSGSQVQEIDMTIANGLQCAYVFDDDAKVDLPSVVEASTISPVSDCHLSWSTDSCLGSSGCLVSVAEDSLLAERKLLSLSASADTAGDCSAALNPFDSTGEVTTTSSLGDCHPKPHGPPERLLSNRKVISPTSQERLCKAMNSIDLDEDKHPECRGKLLFGKETENKVIRAEGCDKMRKAEVTINTKRVLGKPKYEKRGPHPRSNLKGPHISSAATSFSTGCTSPQSLSRNAIAFSQRQMQDIESLATKLTLELSCMKDLVNELFHSEPCQATSLKHNVEKVTMAIKTANKTEETARRWLSIMARDCNRFCKIMKLTEAGSTASGNVVNKERKITFADEAGGKLCHVKVFQDDMAPQLDSADIEK